MMEVPGFVLVVTTTIRIPHRESLATSGAKDVSSVFATFASWRFVILMRLGTLFAATPPEELDPR